MPSLRERFEHPTWFSVGGATVGYLVLLTLMFVLLFVLPYVVFRFV
jgi:hypothetical protein